MTPDDAKKRLQQLKAEAMMRADKEKQYKAATANQYTKDMPSMKEFEAKQGKAGLAKFLEESKVKDRMYHATHGDFNSFRNNHRGIHFVTPSHEFADDFLTNSGQDDHEEGANIMPVHVHAKNPFDYENKKHVNALATKASLGKLGIDQIKKGDWNRIEDRTTLKAIKDLGHDAVYVNENGVKNLGVFHPHQIKSATGNQGTYDLTNPDITKAKGGPIHMAKGGSEISPAVNLQMANEAAEKVGQHSNPYTRSLQQGWEHGWYHGSTGDIKSFRPELLGESTGAASAKKGYFFARDPSTPPAHMVEHDPQSVEMLTKLGKPIPENPTMAGHGAQTAGSYAGTGGSREYKEAMRKAKAAEKSGKWDDYEKYMTEAEDSVSNEMQYRQGLVAKHGDARDEMLEKINNAWYGAQNADKFKKMSQGEYEAHDKLHKELMPYGWYTSPLYDDKMYQNLIGHISSATGHKHSKEAIDAIKKYRSVHNERKAADVESGANILPVALRYKNPMYYDFQGKSYRDQTYSDLMDEAKRKGHDALILKNTYDPGGSGGVDKMVDVGVVFHPHQIRSKFAAFHPDRGNESDLLAARGGPIKLAGGGQPPSLDVMKLALTKHGMYSPLEKATMGVNRTKGTPAEFMAEASKQPGFRKEEVSDRKLQLPDQKLTKAEMLQHLQKSPLPKISEHTLHDFGDEEEALDTAAQHLFGQSYDEIYDDRKAREKVDNWIKANSSKYSTYQLPGGKNYREVLLQTPHFAEHDEHRIMELEADKRRSPQPSHWGMATGEAKELAELMKRKAGMGEQYHSSHWEGHPNVIAHMRMSDRTGPNKEKLLHIEEIQSDLHQEGRKKGYKTPKVEARRKELEELAAPYMDGSRPMPPELRKEIEALPQMNGVPDMPFKKNWHELALKHALHHAAKHGYHGVVITSGQEQAKRYDLSKHINDLQYDPQTKTLSAWDHSGNKVVDKNDVNEDQLSDYIGKEGASKLLAKNTGDTQVKQLFGADLQVGGEGMKGFYDKIVPDYLNKLGKPHGVKVGKMNMPRPPRDSSLTYGYPGAEDYVGGRSTWSEFLAQNPKAAQEFSTPVHYFPITEPMRQQILQGQPMYKQGGIIHKAEGGIVQPSIAQMRMALQQGNPIEAQNIGVNEAPNMLPKIYFSPSQNENDDPTVGNSFNQDGMPVGGVDQNQQQPGQQLMAQQPGQPPQGAQPPQGGLTPQGGLQIGPQGPTPPMGNMLSMTPQGQTMQALAPQGPPGPPGIPSGPPGAPTQPAPTGMKNGGPAYFDKGGLSSSDQEMDAALAHANSIPRSKKPTVAEMKEAIFQKAQQGLMKPSEALGKHEGAYMHITEADRAKVEKRKHGMRGGVGFSQIGLEEPEYAGRIWGVGKSSVQSKLLNRQKRGLSPEDKSIWTTFIGTPEMHTSNQLVFNRMWNKFQEARKSGLLSPEQEAKMLDILRSAMTKATPKKPAQAIFEPDASFDNTHHLFDTFERRRILSDLMAGNKIGGKKGQIFDASKMIEDTTDPRLLHAPTLSVGPHTFSFSGETSHEPHLNKAFPYMLHGEAHPDTFQQIPFTEAAPDFTNQIRQTKGREPGYMDIVRGIPRQHITEKFLTGLQKLGRKKGGDVKLAPTQDTMRLALTKKKAK